MYRDHIVTHPTSIKRMLPYAPLKVNSEGRRQLTWVRLIRKGTLTTAILSDIILSLQMVEIYLVGGDSDSEN